MALQAAPPPVPLEPAPDALLAELSERRERYHDKVRAHLHDGSRTFVDKAITAEGAAFVVAVLNHRRRTSMRMLDMGLGFSTDFVGWWMGEQPDGWTMDYVGVDHDLAWCAFIDREVAVDDQRPLVVRQPHERGAPQWAAGGFDVILVDHGDGKGTDLDTRAADTPWLSTMLKPDGVMLFDDWRPKHEGRIRRALPKGWRLGAAEWTRRFERDKAIGWAVRAC
jgi:hypothetical protein